MVSVRDMFLREVKRQNKDGTRVSYLQLVHNEWDAAAATTRTKILHSFGRTDRLDVAAIERLVASLCRLLDPATALRATSGGEVTFGESRPLGGTNVLDGLWRRLGIDAAMRRRLKGRRITSPFERIVFGLVANRALAPSSKLAAAEWICGDVHIDGLPATDDDACYRAMDWLFSIRAELEQEIYHQVADLLNLQVDLLFFDTTSTYFEVEDADMAAARDWRGEPTETSSETSTDEAGDMFGGPAASPWWVARATQGAWGAGRVHDRTAVAQRQCMGRPRR